MNVDSDKDNLNISCKKFDHFIKTKHMMLHKLMCIYAYRFSSGVPISFLIGFYVSSVLSRWWDQFMTLPYPDVLALKLVAFVPGRVKKQHFKNNIVF